MDEIRYKPIGIIHSPFKDPSGMPIQPLGGSGIKGTIDLEPEFQPALKDLDGFSHIVLLFHLHLSKRYSLEVTPFMDDTKRGLFSTRAPNRPNPIGQSVVRLLKIKDSRLYIEDLDMVDGTPLLDIKPYVPNIDAHAGERIGWLSKHIDEFAKVKADNRFKKK